LSGLTKEQFRTQAFIEIYAEQFGFSPSYEEIRHALGLAAKSGVFRIIGELVERGYLRKLHKRARSIEIIRHVLRPRCCQHCGHDLNETVQPVMIWPKKSEHLRAT